MKLKDIEKKLKNENSEVKVPDVCDRAQKAPINRLLSPVRRVFQKKNAIRILCVCFVLLMMLILTGITLWALPSSHESAVYINVQYEYSDSVYSEGIVIRGDDVVFAGIEMIDDGDMAVYPYEKVDVKSNDISGFISSRFENLNVQNIKISIASSEKDEIYRVEKVLGDAFLSIDKEVQILSSTTATSQLQTMLGSNAFYENDVEKSIVEYIKTFE